VGGRLVNRRLLAYTAFATSLVLFGASATLPFVAGAGWDAFGNPGAIGLFAAPFAVIGFVITLRRPEHPIGWCFAGAGIFSAIQATTNAYADAAFRVGGPHLPLAAYAGNLTQWIFEPSVLLGYTLPFLWFPEGRLLSPRWRWVARLAVAMTALTVLTNIVDPDPLNNYPHIANPMGVHAAVLPLLDVVGVLGFIATLFAAIGSVFLRFRRSRGVERLQMRWFMVGVAGTGLAFAVQLTLFAITGDVGVGVLLMTVLPVCAGIAVLRYRLFDVDRVISRTVTYSLVTALVVTPYAVLSVVSSRLANGSSVAVAALTLATLAVVRPVHRRVQRGVDRKFNRERYDAGRIVDAFAVRLRDEVDPDVVRSDLLDVAATAIQPSAVSLWEVS
jgi:hypothetical protein